VFHFMRSLLLLAALLTDVSAQTPDAGASRRVSIGVLAPAIREKAFTGSLHRGITIGLEEAQRTARMFGWDIVLVRHPDSLSPAAALDFFRSMGVTAVVGELGALTEQRPPDTPVLLDIAAGPRQQSSCRKSGFQLVPASLSEESTGGENAGATDSRVVAWHESLERYGAGQINDRFRARFNAGMDEEAWAGWMAIKILLESALKTGSRDSRVIEAYLTGGSARFDGHKGVPLYFDAETRELVQPIFRVREGSEPETIVERPRGGESLAGGRGPAVCTGQ
jgi:hypothetical protein